MSNEIFGIYSIFFLTLVLLLFRHGLMLIGRRGQKLHGVYVVRLNRDGRKPDPDPEPHSEGVFTLAGELPQGDQDAKQHQGYGDSSCLGALAAKAKLTGVL